MKMAQSRRAQPGTDLEVDLMILDYLLYMATKALLEEQVARREDEEELNLSELPLQMVNSFLRMFKHRHQDPVPETARFRLRLLKFSTLYGRRLSANATTPLPAELEALRQTHRRRAEEWWDAALPSQGNFADPVFQDRLPRSERRTSTTSLDHSESTALADLVPMFVALSAARSELQDTDAANITTQWMELAGEFMLQAALEQCLVYGTGSASKLREIFSWGWRPSPTQVAWDDERTVNHMFCEEGRAREVEGWAKIRREYVEMLTPPQGVPLLTHLQNLTAQLPLDRFEGELLNFVHALQEGQDVPVLVQLENGQVTGLTARETEALKQRIRMPF
ncbi:hypothetical protein EJ08DRAFT_694290 [Tothia fuscella]|uniref:Uncharacterized protein n=1 Tax=Tothia fuscella TaxID=1048955 RepID=A0A9P4NZ89_9PEZI|nr:hypothetical protein EJ08DRAFT_694290 [Tothia fuscella]